MFLYLQNFSLLCHVNDIATLTDKETVFAVAVVIAVFNFF